MHDACEITSRFLPCAMRSWFLIKGSRRAPKRDRVRRIPFATARILPWCAVRMVIIRSASPNFTVLRTSPSSLYSGIYDPLVEEESPESEDEKDKGHGDSKDNEIGDA